MSENFTLVIRQFIGSPDKYQGVSDNNLIGGAEINLYRTAKLLMKMGHDVTILQEDVGNNITEYDGINLEYISTPELSGRLGQLAFNKAWRKEIGQESYVHIQSEDYAIPFHSGIDSVNQQGLTWDYPGRKKLTTKLKKYHLNRVMENGGFVRASDNSFLTYTQATKTKYRNQVFPIPNGVDTTRFSPREVNWKELEIDIENQITILFPRTLRLARGAGIFLESLKIITKDNPNVVALFLGANNSNEKDIIQKKIKQNNLEAHVKFLGHVPHEKMHKYYNATDIVTIPTYHSEGSSISCIEALASGCPVVVTDVGGLKELIYQNVTDGGLKTKPNPKALSTAFKKLIRSPQLREKLGRNARKRALNYYKIERWESDMEMYFKRVIDNGPIRKRSGI